MKKSDNKTSGKRAWWEKPGLGIMYQIEARPGWRWGRDFDKFNASMKDKNGDLNFNGPFCRMKDWVEFSKRAGVDYHIFEAKWHDGICYFDTKYTDWKTPVDYCRLFADESKKAGIPIMFYYSNIYDHNPQFDDIQPLRGVTASFIARHGKSAEEVRNYALEYNRWSSTVTGRKPPDIPVKDFTYNPQKYEKYVLDQLTELIEKYKPDGMWMDWFMGKVENSAHVVMDFMKAKYPKTVLTFNASVHTNLKWAYYTSGEAHTVRAAWESGHRFRSKSTPWELVGPVAAAWDNVSERPDKYECARIAAIIMACGGKYGFGLASQMDGELYPQTAGQVAMAGEWYIPRRLLFTEATPMRYRGDRVPGIGVSEMGFGTVGCNYGDDRLIHIFNYHGAKKQLGVSFAVQQWRSIKRIILEPSGKELAVTRLIKVPHAYWPRVTAVIIPAEDVDPVDTMLRVTF